MRSLLAGNAHLRPTKMKITELKRLEEEQINHLRQLSLTENNIEAARALLEHLRYVSKNIDEWRRNKDKERKEQEPK